jgi:hypothetical protein
MMISPDPSRPTGSSVSLSVCVAALSTLPRGRRQNFTLAVPPNLLGDCHFQLELNRLQPELEFLSDTFPQRRQKLSAQIFDGLAKRNIEGSVGDIGLPQPGHNASRDSNSFETGLLPPRWKAASTISSANSSVASINR